MSNFLREEEHSLMRKGKGDSPKSGLWLRINEAGVALKKCSTVIIKEPILMMENYFTLREIQRC